ncbi:MAG: hypothetical protein DWQ34_28020 [Planctomycetota bacterium]|nr:MAG: hypothetical protein DWQ34_28020 [Planctomycetota bacterium]REK28491.1 MAG: hypothetical protein DWQ41_05955 [Planctomycetota bacterium]REK29089.1 MAG: hypothetical protein DWQ45_23375 [Planctomycetota bacterium]
MDDATFDAQARKVRGRTVRALCKSVLAICLADSRPRQSNFRSTRTPGRAVCSDRIRSVRRPALLLLLCGLLQLTGCAACHPLRGVPASYLPHEYRGDSRSGKRTINLNLLVRRPVPNYRVDSGDVLAVYIPGVLGKLNVNLEEAGEEPPINIPTAPQDPPTIGYPVTVRGDGTIPLPYVDPVHVAGRTLPEVEGAIRRAYSVDTDVLAGDASIAKRIVVSLQRPREYRVLVVRQETSDSLAANNQVGTVNIGNTKKGTAKLVRLRADENDVLHALAKAEGAEGLPGLDAENAIYVIRRRDAVASMPAVPGPNSPSPPGSALPANEPVPPHRSGHSIHGQSNIRQTSGFTTAPQHAAYDHPTAATPAGHAPLGGHSFQAPGANWTPPPVATEWPNASSDWLWAGDLTNMATVDNPNVTRIPVRLADGEYPHVTEADVTLYDGDIVFIESRETEVFYTGGLLGGGQFTLPRDYDLTLTQAISIAQSQAANATALRAIGGVSALNSDVTISPSHAVVLRTLPDGRRFTIEADLYRALRRKEEDISIQPGDMIILQYTPLEAVAAFFERHLLEGAIFGVAASQFQTGGNN